MPEWWAYHPRDFLMFSPDTYYRLFELHNADVWPAQVLVLAAGLAVAALLVRPVPWAGRAVAVLLAAAWGFVAWAYFQERYATINLAAPYYAWAFAAQGFLLLIYGGLDRLRIETPVRGVRTLGLGLVLFALLIQPLAGPLTGHPWAGAELFGLAPDPTVMVTLGVLLALPRVSWALLAIPLLWCAVTGATLATMGSPEAPLMPVLGALALVLALYRSVTRDES